MVVDLTEVAFGRSWSKGKWLIWAFPLITLLFFGCRGPRGVGGKTFLVKENLSEDRLSDVAIVKRFTGQKKTLFFKSNKYTDWFEGFIKGQIVDEEGKPVENIQIIANAVGFENSVTDINGVYKIRFSIPIVKAKGDAIGRVKIHPKWEEELASTGKSYQPTIKEASFRVYYNGEVGVASVNEGELFKKIVVKKIVDDKRRKIEDSYKYEIDKEKDKVDKEKEKEKTKAKKKETSPEDDLFKAIQEFNIGK